MPSNYITDELIVQKAAEEVRNGVFSSFREAERVRNVSRKKIKRAFENLSSRITRQPTNMRLNSTQEQVLVEWLTLLDKLRRRSTLQLLKISANQLLNQAWRDHGSRGDRPKSVKNKWAKLFMRRHKEFKLWKDKPQEKARITAESNAIISQLVDMLKETYEEYSIQPDDFWNYDESGIICGLGGDEYVITLTPRQVVSSKHFNRELITMGECISAAGEVIPPLLIIKGKPFRKDGSRTQGGTNGMSSSQEAGKAHYA